MQQSRATSAVSAKRLTPIQDHVYRSRLIVAVIRSAFPTLLVASGHAGTLTVTSKADSGTGSLRSAVASAVSGDVIMFDCAALGGCPATILLSSQGNGQGFPGPTALVVKNKAITIDGGASGNITLQAQPGSTSATSLRHFYVESGASLTLAHSIVTGGAAIGGNGGRSYFGGGGGAGLGGAIFNAGTLVLDGTSFSGNAVGGGTGGDGGGLPSQQGSGGGGMGGNGAGYCGGGGGTGGDADASLASQYCGYGGPGASGYLAPPGSPGSFGSGGGAGQSGSGGGGHGGFGGGGGSYGGLGGFGGGGGSQAVGGFGGGGGGAFSVGAAGGVGGAAGNNYLGGGGGGGGAAFGGAVFTLAGSSLTLRSDGTSSMSGDVATPHGGAAVGSGLFLTSGVPTTFDVDGTLIVSDTIADDSSSSLPSGHGYTPGAGAGTAIAKQGSGTLILNGSNTHAGITTVSAGTLGGSGDIAGPVTLGSGAAIAPGDPAVNGGVGIFSVGPLTWNSGATIAFQLGSSANDSDLLLVGGQLSNNGTGPGSIYRFHFGMGADPPLMNTTYTLIQSTDASAFAAGNFSFDFDASYVTLSGTFSINSNAVEFTVTAIKPDRVFRGGFE